MSLETGKYILYDDDCGVCTKFSRFIKKFVSKEVDVLPMHHPRIINTGLDKIGFEKYWESFHIVNHGKWATDESAIIALANLLPGGRYLSTIVSFPPLTYLLFGILRNFKRIRKQECATNF